MSSRRPLYRRIAAAFLTLVACGTFIASPVATHVAKAQAVTVVGNVPDDILRVLDQILTQLVRAGTVALFNAAQTFLGQLAYDAATYIASGGKGQNALTQSKSAGDYFAQVGEDALGSAIGSLSDEFFESNIGFDLCQPSVNNLLNIQLSLGSFLPSANSSFSRPRPNCSFQQIVQNWDTFATTLSGDQLLRNINAQFNTNASDVGAALQIYGRTAIKVDTGVSKAIADRGEDGAFKSVTDVVSGNVRTPAGLIADQTREQLVEGPSRDEGQRRNAILSSAADQGVVQLAVYTASMFINTLGSKLMGRILEKGLINAFDFSDLEQQTGVANANPDAIPSRSRADARRANLELRDVNLIRQSNIEILSELIACPDVRGTWNCVMDQQLASAVRGNACDNGPCTIAKATERGLMKPDWRLYPDSMVRQNQDRECYNQAYCSGNLRKLRLMRIVPVGLEFAANSDENVERCASSAGCVTLRELIDGFTDCSATGERDADHPWCKLVDPSWVLTSFEQQCRLTGFGDQLISDRLGQRKEECTDIQTCLKRNDKGECVGGFGYCVAEKTVYRFKGDECSAQAASCRNFSTRSGEAVSYLRNTLDYGVCSDANVGCLGYATLRRPDGSWINAATSTMYFDKTLAPCGAGDEGCTRLLAAEVGGSSLNLLTNASFERTSGAPLQLVAWSSVPAGAFSLTPLPAGTNGANGPQALGLSAGTEYFQRVTASPGRVMTVSLFARVNAAGSSPSVTATINQYTTDTFAPAARVTGAYAGASPLFKSPSCFGAGDPAAGGSGYGTDWRRFECSFLTSPAARFIELRVAGTNTFVDAVQLEEGQFATNYIEGANNALPVVYMKVAPDDFQCTGAATDPESCGKFARTCRQVDAGCQGYTDGTAAPEIPAILSSNDLCPAQCVGYAEYRKQGAAFDLVVDADARFSDPSDEGRAYFIPSSATQCRQEDVGCEVFTNLEAAAEGGEQTAAYSYLRLCEKPDATLSQTYFTWEGSEAAGYQLRTWSLMSVSGEGSAPQVVARRGPDGTFKDPATCNEGLWRTGLDADCRQFYDRAGRVFYAFYSQTVLSSADCKPLRLGGGRVTADDCTKTGGSFNVTTGECSYDAMPSESRSCNVQFAGCRAYAGAAAGSAFLAVNENFRSGAGAFTASVGPATSPESLLVGDQSLRLQSGGGSSLTTQTSFASAPGDLFRVSFWAKGVGTGSSFTLQIRDASVPGSAPVAVGVANLSGDWQRYSFGLFGGYANAATSSLSWTLSGPGTPIAFLDEVRVERVRDTAYVVKDSWNTPAECDQTFSGIPEPQAMLGCRQYTDRFQNKVNASRFTRLCRQEAIGCRAFVDTRNSDAAEAQTFVSADDSPIATRTFRAGEVPTAADFFPSTTTTRPADRMLYLVYETSKLCQSENMSCRAFGKPTYSIDRSSVQSFDTVYFKDDITQYSQALCRPSEQFCEEFSYQTSKDYFKNPDQKVCEYKDGIRLSAFDFFDSDSGTYTPAEFEFLAEGTYSGWFQKGESTPCYPDNLQSGNFFGLPKRGDEPYAGWVGLCQPENGECTEFRDPNDTSDPQYRTGRPYYFVDNSKLDKSTCSGNVDQGAGCILLRNQSNPTLNYSSLATDLAYRDNGFRQVQPIDCAADPNNEFCQARCRGTKVTRLSPLSTPIETPFVGESCEVDTDCALPPEPAGCTGAGCTVTYRTSCVTPQNDANVLVKVNTDRDCSQWLGCQSAETVFDPVTNQYKDVCTNLALCNKTTDTPGDIFCANYVDRTNPSIEPILTQGKFFDVANYTSRQTGLGTNDYSGYAIPDSFQVPDTVVARVGVDGAKTVTDNENRFARDYRLSAVARIPVNMLGPADGSGARPLVANPSPNEARVLETTAAGVGAANPDLRLCQHVGSGIIGYYREEDRRSATITTPRPSFNCYLPIRRESDAYNFQNLVGTFGLEDPRIDSVLAKAYPAPECRANPEADSPFSAKYVTGWDFSTTPPKPVLKINGYLNANVCEYGEDCSCSYKRAEYEIPTLTKFLGPLASNVPPGVCFGGPRNGQSCLPTAILNTTAGSAALQGGVAAANEDQLCGPPEQGGRCIAATKIEVIRGVFGQCLERDSTRILGDDRSAQPCLTWNPNPILFGEKDPFHYQPTSGYLPPQNSGQYYCISPSRQPVSFKMSPEHFRRFYQPGDTVFPPNRNTYLTGTSGAPDRRNGTDSGQPHSTLINYARDGQSYDPPRPQSEFQGGVGSFNLDYYETQFDQHSVAPYYAGKMSRIDYGPQWLEDDNRCAPNECDYMSASLVEAHPTSHYPTSMDCRNAYNATGGGARIGDSYPTAVRLVDAGNGYTETFFRINDRQFAEELGATQPVEYDRFLSDNIIGYLRATPSQGNGGGLMACGYQAAWADNMPPIDYNNADSIRQGERQFRDELARNYVSYMTRGSEQILGTGTPGSERAIQMPCLEVDDFPNTGTGDTDPDNPYVDGDTGELSQCYFKYWETDYRSENEKKFTGIFAGGDEGGAVVRNLNDIRRNAQTGRCEAGKPYFAIRAVFQSRADNTDDTNGDATIQSSEVDGPWRFTGFWVSACAGNAGNDQRYIYMDLEVGAANVCTELAEVQSSGSRQDAAFTDRVWSQSGFREQSIGTTYSDAASPFSSAINTGPAGEQPLFQNGQELAGFSPRNPPTFLQSGVTTYYKTAQYPRDKWAYLTNIFARIYRVYQYRFYPVNRGETACLSGPFKGAACTNVGAEDPACKIDGECLRSMMAPSDIAGLSVCNRGPAKLLSCEEESQCKAAAFDTGAGTLTPLLKNCGMATGWTQTAGAGTPDPGDDRFSSATMLNRTRQQAADDRGFACSGGSVNTAPGSCTNPGANSVECPTLVTGTCRTGVTRTCDFANPITDFTEDGLAAEPVVSCSDNSDCTFNLDDYNAATCGAPQDPALVSRLGRCEGGLRSGQACVLGNNIQNSAGSCNVSYGTEETTASNSCGLVDSGSPSYTPVASCLMPGFVSGPNTSLDPNEDNNVCTHSGGYQPRQDLCPNPSDEYCGLISYNISDLATYNAATRVGSLDPNSTYPLPTDVTLGHYTPTFLGFPSTPAINASTFSYLTYYTPRPPRVAAPDTRNCPVPGQCPISRLDAISLDGLADGSVVAGGGQHKASLRFYAWAAHEQMPLRQVTIDWGDGKNQIIDDTRLKNRKPFCGVQKECSDPIRGAGLTCQVDSDCPPGAGVCVPVGTCEDSPQRTCNTDDDCTIGGVRDTCRIRTMFGNSTDACQQDYFDFTHVFTCGAFEARTLPSCTSPTGVPVVAPGQCYFGDGDDVLGNPMSGFTTRPACTVVADCATVLNDVYGEPLPAGSTCGPPPVDPADLVATRCSRDPSRSCTADSDCAVGDTCIDALAPPSGCFDAASNSCRFTPRVMVQDNWGWCSGECRNTLVGGNLEDTASVKVRHPYGGCYVGNVFNGTPGQSTRINSRSNVAAPNGANPASSLYVVQSNECNPNASGGTVRPWVVYPGSLQLRRSDEVSE